MFLESNRQVFLTSLDEAAAAAGLSSFLSALNSVISSASMPSQAVQVDEIDLWLNIGPDGSFHIASSPEKAAIRLRLKRSAPPSFIADNPPDGTLGDAYSYTFSLADTGSAVFGVASGTTPVGLSLDPVTGILSGVPKKKGTFTFVVSAQVADLIVVTPSLTVTVS
jgi:hypothetical protein